VRFKADRKVSLIYRTEPETEEKTEDKNRYGREEVKSVVEPVGLEGYVEQVGFEVGVKE